ncbi:MAG TPA: hypothetical protein PK948_08205 [Gemmatimonadales bacterium]|nr:hypothetical protein [Gemmatimonadales bacterium]
MDYDQKTYALTVLGEEAKRLHQLNADIRNAVALVESLWGPAGVEDLFRSRRPHNEWIAENARRLDAVRAAIDVLDSQPVVAA